MTEEVKATQENYLELLEALSVREALEIASGITKRLADLKVDNDGYWLEKPWKFPEYWVPALNGVIDDSDLDLEEEYA